MLRLSMLEAVGSRQFGVEPQQTLNNGAFNTLASILIPLYSTYKHVHRLNEIYSKCIEHCGGSIMDWKCFCISFHNRLLAAFPMIYVDGNISYLLSISMNKSICITNTVSSFLIQASRGIICTVTEARFPRILPHVLEKATEICL